MIEFTEITSDDERRGSWWLGIRQRSFVANVPEGTLWVWSRINLCRKLDVTFDENGNRTSDWCPWEPIETPFVSANVIVEFDDMEGRAERGEPVKRRPSVLEIAAAAALVFPDGEWRIGDSPEGHPLEVVLEQLDHCRGLSAAQTA